MYFPDFELCTYQAGPFDAKNWAVPLLAIGWLEHPNVFPTGAAPDGLIPRLKAMVNECHSAYQHHTFRGTKECSYCRSNQLKGPGPIWSQENLFVPGQAKVFLAPGGIVHYIEAHSYLPVAEFIEAAFDCPDLGSQEYEEALRDSNGGIEPPLKKRGQVFAELKRAARLRGPEN